MESRCNAAPRSAISARLVCHYNGVQWKTVFLFSIRWVSLLWRNVSGKRLARLPIPEGSTWKICWSRGLVHLLSLHSKRIIVSIRSGKKIIRYFANGRILSFTIGVPHVFLVLAHSCEILYNSLGQVFHSLQFHFYGLELCSLTDLRKDIEIIFALYDFKGGLQSSQLKG